MLCCLFNGDVDAPCLLLLLRFFVVFGMMKKLCLFLFVVCVCVVCGVCCHLIGISSLVQIGPLQPDIGCLEASTVRPSSVENLVPSATKYHASLYSKRYSILYRGSKIRFDNRVLDFLVHFLHKSEVSRVMYRTQRTYVAPVHKVCARTRNGECSHKMRTLQKNSAVPGKYSPTGGDHGGTGNFFFHFFLHFNA